MGSLFAAIFSYLMQSQIIWIPKRNKLENIHRFALSALRGETFGERKRESFGISYTGYPFSIVKIKRERK